MKVAGIDGQIDVAVGETFCVRRRGRETSGFRMTVQVPDGIERLEQRRAVPRGFGGAPEVVERFRCVRPGSFSIRFEEGRPWEQSSDVHDLRVVAD